MPSMVRDGVALTLIASGATLVDESCNAMSVFHPQPLSQEGEGSFESRWHDFHAKPAPYYRYARAVS